MTFIELVNTAIDEAKITLDPLTPQNFDNPPRTAMYDRVKRWINEALQELLTSRNEWFSRKERVVVELHPRVQFLPSSVTPTVGYTYTGRTSGASFTVLEIHSNTDELTSNTTVSVSYPEDSVGITGFAKNEVLDVTAPVQLFQTGIFKGAGSYDFTDLAPNSEIVDDSSIVLSPSLEDQLDGISIGDGSVRYIRWDLAVRADSSNAYGNRVIARSPTGGYMFFPALNRSVIASYDVTREVTKLVAFDDVPATLPKEYHAYLYWAAVKSYGDFQKDAQIWSRGDKNCEKFIVRMERDLSPKVTMGGNLFYVR